MIKATKFDHDNFYLLFPDEAIHWTGISCDYEDQAQRRAVERYADCLSAEEDQRLRARWAKVREADLFMLNDFWPWFRDKVYPKDQSLPPDEQVRQYNAKVSVLIRGYRCDSDTPQVLEAGNLTDAVPEAIRSRVVEWQAIIDDFKKNARSIRDITNRND